jgi:hypothetical protein
VIALRISLPEQLFLYLKKRQEAQLSLLVTSKQSRERFKGEQSRELAGMKDQF